MHYSEMIPPDKIAQYKQMGATDQDLQKVVDEVKQEEGQGFSMLRKNVIQPSQQNTPTSYSRFGAENHENLIKWQLEMDSILERIEHLVRGDVITVENGNVKFIPTTEEKQRVFNDFGVAEIMRLLAMYLNRNTILSNMDEQTILDKVYDLGIDLADLIFNKSEEMGLDTIAKRKLFPIIHRQIVDTVHFSLLRALNGGERQSLHESRTVTQSESMGSGVTINNQGMPNKERGLLNPMRWIGGKYK